MSALPTKADIRPTLCHVRFVPGPDFHRRTANSIAVKENEDALAEIKKSGKTTLHTLTDAQRKAWQTAMAPTYKWAKGRVGQEVLDLVAKELDIKMN
jgi:hypothetical protein